MQRRSYRRGKGRWRKRDIKSLHRHVESGLTVCSPSLINPLICDLDQLHFDRLVGTDRCSIGKLSDERLDPGLILQPLGTQLRPALSDSSRVDCREILRDKSCEHCSRDLPT